MWDKGSICIFKQWHHNEKICHSEVAPDAVIGADGQPVEGSAPVQLGEDGKPIGETAVQPEPIPEVMKIIYRKKFFIFIVDYCKFILNLS